MMKKLFFIFFIAINQAFAINPLKTKTGQIITAASVPLIMLGITAQIIDAKKEGIGAGLQQLFRDINYLPQYTYIAKPTYIYFGGKDNPLVSVPTTFAVTDILMHRLLPETLFLCSKSSRNQFRSNWQQYLRANLFHPTHLASFTGWVALSIPIAMHKHQKLNK